MTTRRHECMLPGKDSLLEACRGWPKGRNPILTAAGELAELHEVRLRRPAGETDEIDRARLRWAEAIDRWVAVMTPVPSPHALLHTETVGHIVDRMAQLTAHAYLMLTNGFEMVFYDVRTQLDDLATGYEDLVTELHAGTRRLPIQLGSR
ncbi:DUF4254 domain-containing protein [Nocardia sp. 2YAB30]|uniref:DUF4254 domain-containing protein n=1 Tax=unclassified Nocardia TaxID=2637762 RepID=UPI003F9AF928